MNKIFSVPAKQATPIRSWFTILTSMFPMLYFFSCNHEGYFFKLALKRSVRKNTASGTWKTPTI